MTDRPIPYPHAPGIPQATASLSGARVRLSLQPSAMYRMLAIAMLGVVCGAVAAEVLSIVLQNNHLKHVINEQATVFFAALLRIASGTLTVNVDDSCPTQQGVFVLDNTTSPPTTIAQNDDVPPGTDEFDLDNLTWDIPDGSLLITGNYTIDTGSVTTVCCDPMANPVGTQCDCVWPLDSKAQRFEKCGTRGFYTLDYDYCEAELTIDQQLGIDDLQRSFDANRTLSSTNKLNITHSQVRIDGNLTTGGTQQLPTSAAELIPAYNRQQGHMLLSDVVGCPLVSGCNYPDPFAYEFSVFEIVKPMLFVLNVPFWYQQENLDFCLDTEVFPIDPNPYVQKNIGSASVQSDVNTYYYNDFAFSLLSCGTPASTPPITDPGVLTAANLFDEASSSWISSPPFPIRKGATYRVEFGCTAINMYLTTDDDELYAAQEWTPSANEFIGKFQMCSHLYDNLADDDACTLPTQSIREEYATYLSALIDIQNTPSATLNPVIDNAIEEMIAKIKAADTAAQPLRGAACCDMRYDSSCISPPKTLDTALFSGSAGLFSIQLPTRQWNATAFQLYTICAGVSSDMEKYQNSTDGLRGNMFFSVQRVNPMVWGTGSEGMSFDLEGHAYWAVNDTVLEQNPGFFGQCGVYSAATPFLFNSDQQTVDPSISMKDVPGFEDLPYPNQVAGDLPSFNHMCSTNSTMLSNCYVRVRSFLPGEPEVVSSTNKKRESSIYEPATGHVYWKGAMKDMHKAGVWSDKMFKSKREADAVKKRVYDMMKKADREYNEEKREKIRRQHQANVDSVLSKARRPPVSINIV